MQLVLRMRALNFHLFKIENFACVAELVALCTGFCDFGAPTTFRLDKMARMKECVGLFVEHTRAAICTCCVCNVDELLLAPPILPAIRGSRAPLACRFGNSIHCLSICTFTHPPVLLVHTFHTIHTFTHSLSHSKLFAAITIFK